MHNGDFWPYWREQYKCCTTVGPPKELGCKKGESKKMEVTEDGATQRGDIKIRTRNMFLPQSGWSYHTGTNCLHIQLSTNANSKYLGIYKTIVQVQFYSIAICKIINNNS